MYIILELTIYILTHYRRCILCYHNQKLYKVAWILRLKNCANIIRTIRKKLFLPEFQNKHKFHPQDFTRKRSLPFSTILLFIMNLNTTSLTREIRNFFGKSLYSKIKQVSKSAVTQARHKFSHSAYIDLNNEMINLFYSGDDHLIKKWHGYRLVAFDGSTVRLPNTTDVIQHFGVMKPRCGDHCPMGRVSLMYDVLNDMTIDAILEKHSIGEITLAFKHSSKLDNEDLVILDRGYHSFTLFASIRDKGSHFCARVDPSHWKFARELLASEDKEIFFTLTPGWEASKKLKELGITTAKISVRAVKITLKNGTTEILLTSLIQHSVTIDDLKNLYQLRWPIEEKYKVYKSRVLIERFSGKSAESVYQDFYAKVFSVNITSLITNIANMKVHSKYEKRKHQYKVNFTEALSIMKTNIKSIWKTDNIKSILEQLIMEMIHFVEPVRKGRSYPRVFSNKSKKYNPCYMPIS